jgi:hypothetical protein
MLKLNNRILGILVFSPVPKNSERGSSAEREFSSLTELENLISFHFEDFREHLGIYPYEEAL